MAADARQGAVRRRIRTLALHPAALHPAAAPLGTLAAAAAAAVYLSRNDPHQPGHLLPRCPFNWATGLLCPFCGGTRMAYDLTHGDLVTALHDNALLLAALPLGLLLYGRWLVTGLRGRRYQARLSSRGTFAVLGVAAVWMVVRNIT